MDYKGWLGAWKPIWNHPWIFTDGLKNERNLGIHEKTPDRAKERA